MLADVEAGVLQRLQNYRHACHPYMQQERESTLIVCLPGIVRWKKASGTRKGLTRCNAEKVSVDGMAELQE